MKIVQFHEIENMEKNLLGRKPFYDSKSKTVVFR